MQFSIEIHTIAGSQPNLRNLMDTWEKLIIGAFMVLLLFWIFPRIKPRLEQDREAPKDWAGVLVPMGLVALFVVFLISLL